MNIARQNSRLSFVDDLEGMGASDTPAARVAADQKHSWLDDALARFLHRPEDGSPSDLALKERELRETFANAPERVTMTAVYASLLRADGVPELSVVLRETICGGIFVDEAFQSSGESVLSYPLNLPILGLDPHCTLFVNDGFLPSFSTFLCGTTVNRGQITHLTHTEHLFIDVGVVDRKFHWKEKEYLYQYVCQDAVDLRMRPGAVYRGGRSEIWCTTGFDRYRERIPARDASVVWEYLDEVLAIARENPAGLFDRYGPDPQRTITKGLQEILEPEVRND